MTNQYFNFTQPLTRFTLARAEQPNALFQTIETGFDKLPTPVQFAQDTFGLLLDTGTANAYAVAFVPAAASYATGMRIVFVALNANTGACTLNVNGLGAKALRAINGTALVAGDISAGQIIEARYDGTEFRLLAPSMTAIASASTSAANAATSEANAAASAGSASASASSASASASAAGASETAAAASASAAGTSETNAAGSASAAGTSETNAANSASAAAASETNAAGSASAAGTSATNAGSSETNAAASASAASTSASNAAASASAASTARTGAEAALDAFDDTYLGAKASDPALDNDGNALATGALYFNTGTAAMRVYNGAAWVNAYTGNPTFASLTVDTDTLHVDPANNRVGVGTTTPSKTMHVRGGNSGATPDANALAFFENFGTNVIELGVGTGGGGGYQVSDSNGIRAKLFANAAGSVDVDVDPGNVLAGSDLKVKIDGTERLRVGAGGISTNLGTDFLTYETGTWTVQFKDQSSNTSPTTGTGRYSRVGNQVTCWFPSISNISTAGLVGTDALLLTLPLIPADGNAVGGVIIQALATWSGLEMAGHAFTTDGLMRLRDTTDTGPSNFLKVSELSSGVSDLVGATITYRI